MLEKIPRFSGKKQRLHSSAAGMLLSLLLAASPVLAQDTAVVPANDNTKVAWVNGGTFTGTVTATATGWTNLPNVVDNNTGNYGLVAYSGNGTQTTPWFPSVTDKPIVPQPLPATGSVSSRPVPKTRWQPGTF